MEIKTKITGDEQILELIDFDLNNAIITLDSIIGERVFKNLMCEDNKQVNQATPSYNRNYKDGLQKQQSNLIIVPTIICQECQQQLQPIRTLKGFVFEHSIEERFCNSRQDQYVRFEYLQGTVL